MLYYPHHAPIFYHVCVLLLLIRPKCLQPTPLQLVPYIFAATYYTTLSITSTLAFASDLRTRKPLRSVSFSYLISRTPKLIFVSVSVCLMLFFHPPL